MNLVYNQYSYLFPPRPENKISIDTLHKYDNGEYVGQPKFNGSCCVVFMNDNGFLKVMNRHREELSLIKKDLIDFQAAYRGEGFLVICGELLNKNKKGENDEPFNQKFIIWDILVYNGFYLIGTTTLERLDLLENLYPCKRIQVGEKTIEMYNHICGTGITGIYKAPAYLSGFEFIYNDLVKTDLYEGIVLKRKDAQLSYGYNEKNNSNWQIKLRKPTKNYTH